MNSSVDAMEMVEEGQKIQPEIPPNRINFQEFVGEEDDRISALPDCLLHEILSRLPSTKEAIITSTLSKRWKHVWTCVHTLNFTSKNFYRENPNSKSDFVSFVDKTLTQCRQLKLQKFQVITCYDIRSESQFNNWIRFAITRNVEQLILRVSNWESQAQVLLDQFFFLSSCCFTHLIVQGCKLNPSGAITWKILRFLYMSFVKLDEDLIDNILSGSPLLENLVLNGCYGYRRLEITSNSAKNLVLLGFFDPDNVFGPNYIEINAPNILSLTIQGCLSLWKLLLVNVSSLVEASLDFRYMCRRRTTRARAEEEMLKGFILNLCHVKELKIGELCSKAVSRLEAKSFIFPSNIKFTYSVEN